MVTRLTSPRPCESGGHRGTIQACTRRLGPRLERRAGLCPPSRSRRRFKTQRVSVDAILASLARGRLSAESWDQLHAAARRDGRVEDVAAAFAKVSWGARMKTVQPSVAAEFLFQGARFFDEVLGDDLGASMYLERSLALAPGHRDAFAKMEAILEGKRSFGKLADLFYATAAPHSTRGQQALMLRRAAEWSAALDENGGQPPVDESGSSSCGSRLPGSSRATRRRPPASSRSTRRRAASATRSA